jgi:hypothetical protein
LIPDFDEYGNLPPGIHICTLDELRGRFGFNYYRLSLIDGLERGINSLKKAGCTRIYIDGSFVTSKYRPNDFDACWDESGVNPDLLDPVLKDFTDKRRAQKRKYNGEFFPSTSIANPPSTIYIDFFQRDKQTGNTKGIVQINF